MKCDQSSLGIFKDKFPGEIEKIANQRNNVLNFCYAIHQLLIVRDANTGLDLRQKEAMRNMKQLQLLNWNYVKPFVMTS